MDICRSQDAVTNEVCRELVDHRGVGLADLDIGYEQTRLVPGKGALTTRADRTVTGAGDRVASDPEIWQKAIRIAQTDGGFRSFLKARREIPWDPDDMNPGTKEDEELTRWMNAEVNAIHAALVQQGFNKGDFSYSVEFWRRFFGRLTAPSAAGGLALAFNNRGDRSPRTLRDVYRERKANCVEFVNLFLMASGIAGLDVVPLELFQDASGGDREHVRIGLLNPASGRIEKIADLADDFGPAGYFGDTIPGETLAPISRRELFAYYYNLKGARENNPAKAESYVDFALRLDPNNYLILFNKAYYCNLRHDLPAAERFLLDSIAANPSYPSAYWNLYLLAGNRNNHPLAAWALERYQGLGKKP